MDPELQKLTVTVFADGSSAQSSTLMKGMTLKEAQKQAELGARGGMDKAIGTVHIPKSFLLEGEGEEESWFVLIPPGTEKEVAGDLKVRVHYSCIDDDGNEKHIFDVTVIEGRQLISKDANGN